MLLHKRKDGDAGWLYRYTLQNILRGRRREIGLKTLRGVSLKQTRTTGWRAILRKGRDPIIKNMHNKSAKQCVISII
ncbi:hypothetical protein ABID23_000647 [Bartonella silvatica]|uniref:Integrase n=1 Tax=Bartonella silvatica TaxID=357760 RepID=A0ABV2HGB9_9HYPH